MWCKIKLQSQTLVMNDKISKFALRLWSKTRV